MKSLIVFIFIAVAVHCQSSQIWNDLRVTFKSVSNINSLDYNQVPMNLNQQGDVYPFGTWVIDNTDQICYSANRSYLGFPYMSITPYGSSGRIFDPKYQRLIRSLYDHNGYILGFQIMILKSNYQLNGNKLSTPTGAAARYYNLVTVDNLDYYALTAYVNYPSDQQYLITNSANYTINVKNGIQPCTYGRTGSDFNNLGFGTGLWLQITGVNKVVLNPSNETTFSNNTLQYVPYSQYDIDSDPLWVRGNCLNGQGTAYFYNPTGATKTSSIQQSDWIPYVPLYTGSRLAGLYILTQQPYLQENPRFEVPTILQLEQTFGIKALPNFFYNNYSNLTCAGSCNTGLHLWFLSNPGQSFIC